MNDYFGIIHPPGRKATCEQCKTRKVRCCGNTDAEGCSNCIRLGFQCSFHFRPPDGLKEGSTAVARRRGPKACEFCRKQRTRCSEGPGPCSNCQKHEITCEYAPSRRGGRKGARKTVDRIRPASTDRHLEEIQEKDRAKAEKREENTSKSSGRDIPHSFQTLESMPTPHMVVPFETELAMPFSAFSPLQSYVRTARSGKYLILIVIDGQPTLLGLVAYHWKPWNTS